MACCSGRSSDRSRPAVRCCRKNEENVLRRDPARIAEGRKSTELRLLRPRDVHVKTLKRRSNPPYNFRRPQRLAQQRSPAIFRLAYSTKGIPLISRLVSVQPAPRKFFLQRHVRLLDASPRPHPKRFALKPLEDLFQLRFGRLPQHHAALGGIAIVNFVHFAKFAHAVNMTEEIEHVTFLRRQRRKSCRPDGCCFFASHRLATLGPQQLQSHRLHPRPKIERLHVQRKRRQIERSAAQRRTTRRAPSTSSCSGGNFAWNAGDCFRTSSQSKKTSGVSSQMRNQLAISSFSARFCASTL